MPPVPAFAQTFERIFKRLPPFELPRVGFESGNFFSTRPEFAPLRHYLSPGGYGEFPRAPLGEVFFAGFEEALSMGHLSLFFIRETGRFLFRDRYWHLLDARGRPEACYGRLIEALAGFEATRRGPEHSYVHWLGTVTLVDGDRVS